jgi:hypothetical protein
MAGTGIKDFEVNGSTYHVIAMAADRAFRFGLKAGTVLQPILGALAVAAGGGAANPIAVFVKAISTAALDPEKLAAIAEECRDCFILPDNRKASDPLAFAEWFRDHPADMFQASAVAVWKLVEDFFPGAALTKMAAAASTTTYPATPKA